METVLCNKGNIHDIRKRAMQGRRVIRGLGSIINGRNKG